MGKAVIILFLLVLISTIAIAQNFEYRYSPYTAKRDRTLRLNQSGQSMIIGNLTLDNLIALGAINTTTLKVEGESNFKDHIHISDNVKTYYGDADDVSVEFNESDLVWLAEVGSPNFDFDAGTFVIDTGNNRVGIGTHTPVVLMHIQQSENLNAILRIESKVTNKDAVIEMGKGTVDWSIFVDDSNNNTFTIREAGDLKLGDSTSYSVLTLSGGDATFTGNVGIGTTSPGQKLVVVGDVNVTGNITIGNIASPLNITGFRPDGVVVHCGVDNSNVWRCN